MKQLVAGAAGLLLGIALVVFSVRAQEEEAPVRKVPGANAPGAKGGAAKGGAPKGAPAVAPKQAPKGTPKTAPKGALKGAPGKAKGAEGEEDEGGEGALVLLDTDAVVLRDGTRISGTILAAGQAAVTILTHQGEKTIPRETIERIVKNADAGLPTKFAAEEADGHKYLQDTQGAIPAPPKGAEEPKGPDIVSATPAAPAAPAAPVAPAAPAAPAPKAVAPVGPAPAPKAVEPPAKAEAPVKGALPAITFPKTQPELHALIEKLRKEGTLNDYLADPTFREGFRQAVRDAFRNEAPKKEE
ncbi:MAG TPA: hypothetical protein PLE19_09465 [Planctomycetota bacterium]|nr:hypothetical protein [Planctomycetota bacterium]HRR79515.1 hypothetical protein [Planctomycetota bacterium]HRT96948.1 hypothetical protein [Planctomycetota bacterium]